MSSRREFITLLGGAAVAWPLAARAQQGERMRRIGVLMNTGADEPESQARLAAFMQGLQELGWAVGRNMRIDHRWSQGPRWLLRFRAKRASLFVHWDRRRPGTCSKTGPRGQSGRGALLPK